jgi:hypothetical protein
LTEGGGIELLLRFRPNPVPDGAFERTNGAPIPIPPPDWDRALSLLRTINALKDSSGTRISSRMVEDGFEPWWYSQDRLFRFFLVPLTQLLPLLEEASGWKTIRIENLPADAERVLRELGGRMGFPTLAPASAFPASRGQAPASRGQAPASRGQAPALRRLVRWAGSVLGQGGMLALSLVSLALFRLGRRDTIFYIVDHVSPGQRTDFRFAPLYRELDRSGYRYAEYAHTLSPRQAIENFFRRGRPVYFVEAADIQAGIGRVRLKPPAVSLPSWEGKWSVEERALWALVPMVLADCADSAVRQRVLKKAVQFQHARRAVIFDDNRHNHELIAACLSLGLPVLGFQHGVFNEYHTGLMAYGFENGRRHAFDRYGVWSGLFQDRLLKHSHLYDPQRLFLCGPIRPPEGRPGRAAGRCAGESGKSPADRIRVLVVSEPLARKTEVARFLKILADDPGMELYLKLRPGESARSLEEYSLPAGRVRLLQSGTVYEAFAQVDVAVGTYSTVLYEAALAEIPVVWMRTSRAYGRELVEEGIAEEAKAPEEMPAAVQRAAGLSEANRRRRRIRIWGEEIRDGTRRLIEEMKNLDRRS